MIDIKAIREVASNPYTDTRSPTNVTILALCDEVEKRDAVLKVALWNLRVFSGRDFVDEAISNIEEVLG